MPAPSTHPAIVLKRPSMPRRTSLRREDWGLLYAAGARGASRGVGGFGAGGEAGIYPRYPRYPQAVCAWTDSLFMTAIGRGRDDLPATGESLPSHSLSQSQAGRLRAA